jgi:hypothetical protein
MRALKTFLVTKHGFVAEGFAWAPAEAAVAKKEVAVTTHLKDVALFLAAPFVGLAYVITFPLIGFGMIAWILGKKLLANKTARPIALAIAAPFATIALVTVAPVVGLGALAWVGGRALLKR